MAQDFTILVCSAGSRVTLLECFRESARDLGLNLRILATDPEPELSAACQLADQNYAVSDGTEREFVPDLLRICEREGVGLVVPTVDPNLEPLSLARESFAAVGTRVAISGPEVVRLARDKLATARALEAAGMMVPRTQSLAEFMDEPERLTWPVIAKPVAGTSSTGLIKPRRRDDLRKIEDDYVVQEMWRGREFTVNLYFNAEGRLRCALPHWRMRVRSGVVEKGRTERVPVLMEQADRLARILPGARGPLCFQAIVNDFGVAAVFELNARLGGGYELAHRAGAPFVRWLLEEAAGRPLTAANDWREGVTMLRYAAAVFRE